MKLLTEISKEYSIRLARHKLKFCKIYPLTELDEIILELLYLHKGHLGFNELGELLGFAVYDCPSEKNYYDKAEVSILEDLLETLQRYHLLTVGAAADIQREIQCTPLGSQALINKKKRLFFEGTITLPEHYLIEITEKENAYFPFKKFGINSIIKNSKECDPYEILDSTEENELLLALARNNIDDKSIEQPQIELSEINEEVIGYNQKTLNATISLLDTYIAQKLAYELDGISSPELYEFINPTCNTDVYNTWLIEARYQSYLESSKQFSSEGLVEFKSVADWSKILHDKRLEWNSQLLELLSDEEIASSQIWTIISENASHDLITENITKYRNLWNWFRLTERLSFSFILDHANDFDWDFDALVSKVGSDDIQNLLEKLDNDDSISDWPLVTARVSFEFLKENLKKYPWDLHLVTKESNPAAAQLIHENFDLDWDWSFIASNWPAHIILDNYEKLWDRLNLRSFLIRLLRDANEFETLMSSNHHIKLLSKTISDSGITFSTTDDVILNETTLAFLDNNNLLFWGEGNISGIEGNPNLIWDEPIFKKYNHKVKSEKGSASVSASIPSFEIIDANPDFPWDFALISKRKNLDWNIEIIEAYKESLPPQNLLTHLSASFVSDNLQFFINWLSQLDELCVLGKFISQQFSFSQIQIWAERLIIHKVSVNWDSVLRLYSEEMLADIAIHLQESTADLPFPDGFQSYLTRNCNVEFILENPDLSWDWNYLTENRLDESQLGNEDFRFEHAEQLYWPYILQNIVSVEDLSDLDALTRFAAAISKAPTEIIKESWEVITGNIRRHKLWEFIPKTEKFDVFHWDWDMISSMDNLEISRDFLNKYKDRLNWNLLSHNTFLNKFFLYDSLVYKTTRDWINRCLEYLNTYQEYWDFHSLSKVEELTCNVTIILQFEERWDWNTLSSANNFLTYKNKETGEIEYHKSRLRKFSKNINWSILSKRYDVKLDTNLLSEFSNEDWDWSLLSAHPKFEINQKFIEKNSEKELDYQALTNHPKLRLNKKLLLKLHNKDWDFNSLSIKHWIDNEIILGSLDREWNWTSLSENNSLIPDLNLLKVFEGKDDINWKSVVENPDLHITLDTVKILDGLPDFNGACWNILSIHPKLDFDQHPELLYNYRNAWNWVSLVEGQKLDFNNLELLRKYENYLDWGHLSRQEQFKPTVEVLSQYKHKLDWRAITEKVVLSNTLLDQFKDYLNWSYISESDAIKFTPELIEQFKLKWDYYKLKENVALSYESRSKVSEIIHNIPELEFYFKLKEQGSKWSGYIYHFTHIQNATKIIQSQTILSRNKAHDIADAAGTVVQRRGTSHDYARFYYRPQTPTQYYNECLGADIDLRNFDQAQKLGLPKCPIPVFFRFNLQEVLLTMKDKCYISNGNMQTNWAKENPISQMMSSFTFKDLYSTIFDTSDNDWRTYIRYSQQEFLVKDHFDFSNLRDVQIIVRSNEDRDQLKALLERDEFARKIIVDNPSIDVFHYGNKKIEYSYRDGILSVNTDYKGDGIHHGEIHLDFFSETPYDIINGQVINIIDKRIVAYPGLTVKIPESASFQLLFHDDRKDESWQIFTNQGATSKKTCEALPVHLSFTSSIDSFLEQFPSYSEIYHSKVRHYTLYQHTQLVCEQFEKYFKPTFKEADPDLFKFFLIVHDIGKPAAFKSGNKIHQHKFTVEELNRIWPETPFSSSNLELLKALASGDPIGEFMQDQREVDDVKNYLTYHSKKASIPIEKLFHLFIIYYQCDTAAYTADAGGIKFLEHLFEYDGNMKRFDTDEGILKFSESYRFKYDKLKEYILHGDRV